MAGGYDEAALRRLGEQLSAQRLLQMLTLLQSAAAGLARSANRRTDAELCLIQLSDEGLDESFAGLSARIARLEERLLQGIPAPAVQAEAVKAGGVPSEKKAPSLEEDRPPWEEELPPPPDDPPPEEPDYSYDEPAPAPSRTAPSPRPTAAERVSQTAPASEAGSSAFWPSFAAGLRGKVSPAVMPYLNNPAKVTGTWKNGRLTLWVDSELTRTMLNKPAVLEKLGQSAAAAFGGQPQVDVAVGAPPAEGEALPAPAGKKDPLDELMPFEGQFDNITIR